MEKVRELVNYGYECKGWSRMQKERLANELIELIMPYQTMNAPPEIEIDGAYPGVRLRKLTWIPEKELDELIAKADAIYDKIAKARKKAIESIGKENDMMNQLIRQVV